MKVQRMIVDFFWEKMHWIPLFYIFQKSLEVKVWYSKLIENLLLEYNLGKSFYMVTLKHHSGYQLGIF